MGELIHMVGQTRTPSGGSGECSPGGRTRTASAEHPSRRRRGPEPLWRGYVGAQLRAERVAVGLRLVDAAARAGVSPQYLSEVERGLKDPSSELLAAMSGALDLTVIELVTRVLTVPAAGDRSGPNDGTSLGAGTRAQLTLAA